MTLTRRLMAIGPPLALLSSPAIAATRRPYTDAAFLAAQEARGPILVHVTAPWCGECKLQKPIVARLADEPRFKELTIFDVDFDTQKDALRRLNVRKQSTLIAFKGGSETMRLVGDTRPAPIEALMNKAL